VQELLGGKKREFTEFATNELNSLKRYTLHAVILTAEINM
jgi:hypothetical protein